MLYLLTEYGNEKMNDLFRAFKEGSSVDDALLEVYGLDRDALDNAWRDSVGLGPREEGEDRSTVIEDEVISGPEVADDEQSSEQAAEAEQDRAEESQVEDDGEDQRGSQQQTGQAVEAGDQDEAESASATSRSDEEIADRVAEIERRQDERRPRPIFEVAGPFPWEWPLIGIAGGLVLLSGLLLVRVLTARD